ncbi:hypothetical protein TRFO_12396 [Tritrichomonas foetus]|uniref:Uncharacterized protein n=1 Tax=Tritrichomonas foetus TaxID=1144522 RepID=A0A1J4L1Y9_9EUKA|nr:hypothetical protein TRFO_12396 [Tritrichomonas foetus]|eukprot:OHT17434.1 hypothetical protein TRFO_12396 [Tritrichomonas foetus]
MSNNQKYILNTKQNYVYNPTDEWVSCTLQSSDQIHIIEVIPPRSSRNYPASFQNPKYIIKVLRPEQIRSFDINATESDPVFLEPIDIKFEAVWKGTFKTPGRNNELITAEISVDSANLSGFFKCNDETYLLKGTIFTKTHHVACSLFEVGKRKELKLNGMIEHEINNFTIELKAHETFLTLTVTENDKLTFEEYPVLKGNYIGFYIRGNDNQYEMTFNMTSFTNGIILGTGCETRLTFNVIGYACNNSMYLVRIGTNATYYQGTIENGGEVYISGNWYSRVDTGNFTFIKEM